MTMMIRIFLTMLLIDVSISILVKNEERVLSASYPLEQSDRFQTTPDKFETVKKFLRHYNSLRPVALLIDDTPESCEDAVTFVRKIFELAPRTRQIKFLIYKFNESGILPLEELYGNETDRIEGLLSYDTNKEQSFLGARKSNGSVAFFAILNAAVKLPRSSAILMFIDRKIQDEDLTNHVTIVRDKDIKVYVVWGGKSTTKTNEERLLREICDYSGGLFLINSWKSRNSFNYRKYLEKDIGKVNTSIVTSRQNLKGITELEFPIDGEVMSIHIRITPPNTEGILTAPSGVKIQFSVEETITSYGETSFSVADDTLRDVYLDAATAPEVDVVGQWRAVFENDLLPYSVAVFVDTPLTANATIVHKNKDSIENTRQVVKLGISGNIGQVNHVSFLDSTGEVFLNKTVKRPTNSGLSTTTNSKYSSQYNEFDIVLDNTTEPNSVLLQGQDAKGNKFSRMTYVGQQSDSNVRLRPSLTLDVGEGSELRADGGTKPVIIFEVTNMRTEPVRVRFYCQDTKSLLLVMDPQSRLMSPLETAKVTLTLTAPFGTYQDEVTFIAEIGNEFVQKKVLIDIGMTHGNDDRNPSLDYTFPSDCSQVALSNCGDGMWTVQVKAKDDGSGLLQVTSYPRGIYFPDDFVTGTKDYVTGVYSESCCNPDLRITAVDIANNRNIITINAFRSSWNAAQISALVFGILVLLLIIAILIFLCVRCKRKDSFELPRYRGGDDI